MILTLLVFTVIGAGGARSAVLDQQLEHAKTANVSQSTATVAPNNLKITSFTSDSIRLKWNLDTELNPVRNIRIFYKHQKYEDVKTIKGDATEFQLQGLDPYTVYEIWVRSVGLDSKESEDSAHIRANTDVAQPSAPFIANLTCYNTGTVYLEWVKPDKYYKSIDYYMLYYKKASDLLFSHIPIEASEEVNTQKFFLENLKPSNTYVIKVCAGTKSLAPSHEPKWGLFSMEKEIYLPFTGCDPEKAEMNQTDESGDEGEWTWGMMMGAVFAVIFLFLACLGFVLWRKRCIKRSYYQVDERHFPRRTDPPLSGQPDWDTDDCPSYPVEDLESHVAKLHADSDIGFAKEYEEIQRYCITDLGSLTHEHCSHADNKCKNRYLNIVAYDHSRVVLTQMPGQKKSSDYVNANFIDGFDRYNAYIGTQGPLEETLDSYWRMIWEQNVYVVVMITNLMERGRVNSQHLRFSQQSLIIVNLRRENVTNIGRVRMRHRRLTDTSKFPSNPRQ